MMIKDLQGSWELCLDADKKWTRPPRGGETICLPDSTAHAAKGRENRKPSIDHMTDRFYFEGYAWYSRTIEVQESWTGKDIRLFLERTRISTVYVDGVELDTQDSLCGFHVHDLTGRLTAGEHRLSIRVDNTDYPTRGGHMTSPDTQTNWNGILGRIELQICEHCRPDRIRVIAETPQQVHILAQACRAQEGCAEVTVRRKADKELLYQGQFPFENGCLQAVVCLEGEDLLWDEYHPNLLQAEVRIEAESVSTDFGIRRLSHRGRRLLVNEKEVFWRGKHDGLVFPRTGYAPMTVQEWREVFAIARSYGINHYRFHTCCPPEAAFTAADEAGIYLEPEIPFWGTIAAPGEEGYQEAEQSYLIEEGYRILQDFGNHPSFVMLSMGNELWGSMDQIGSILRGFKEADGRRLYTQGSNNFQFTPAVLEEEDVYCGVRLGRERLFRGSYAMCDAPQGHIQTAAPNSCHYYDAIIAPRQIGRTQEQEGYIEIQYGTGTKKVRAARGVEDGTKELVPRVPVLSHEIGQYAFFPDFTELGRYEGSQQPLYLEVYRERMEKSGIFSQWRELYRATGALAVDCYRREIETALRTRELSGFQLLDLQDFPGQCVALVGVLNAWMDSKGLITPGQWRQFCSDTVILAELESFIVRAGQRVRVPLRLSVCNWETFSGTLLQYRISLEGQMIAQGKLPIVRGTERLQEAGAAEFTVGPLERPGRVQLELQIPGTEYTNTYTLWAYPKQDTVISEKCIVSAGKTLYIARTAEEICRYREQGLPFIYIPDRKPGDIEGTYCTDFWNYPMFRSISESMGRRLPVGTLGLYIHKEDALLEGFPCECHSTPQWYQLVTHSHCTVLDQDNEVRIIVQPIDNVERCHRLGMLYYHKDVLVCTSRLWEIGEYPEVQAFAKSLVEARVAKTCAKI